MTGRPTIFTQELADYICAEIASGRSVRDICRQDEMPDRATVYRWLIPNKDFCDQYAKALEIRADHLADEMFEIADNGDINGESPKRSALRIDVRKWSLARMQPKKYGDRVQLADADGNTFKVIIGKDDAGL